MIFYVADIIITGKANCYNEIVEIAHMLFPNLIYQSCDAARASQL
jgi:hypothetical protein